MYALRAVVLIPKDRMRHALEFGKDITNAISNFRCMGPDDPEWELPVCLKDFAIEADHEHLLEILDISITQGKFKIWEEVTGILCRFKTVNEIGTSRMVASTKKFSFKKVKPL